MNTLRLQIGAADGRHHHLYVDVAGHPMVQRWLATLRAEIENDTLLRKDHFMLGHSNRSLEDLVAETNDLLDDIANYDFVSNALHGHPVAANPQLVARLDLVTLREDRVAGEAQLNRVHSYFPLLAGSLENTSPYMYAASNHIKKQIQRLNPIVHEVQTAWYSGLKSVPCIHYNIAFQREKNDYADLHSGFDELFTPALKFGDVYLGFPQIGKTHFEAFLENDEALDDGHVEPIRYLSAEFLLNFGYDINAQTIARFYEWMKAKGFACQDPGLRLGFGILGRVDMKRSFGALAGDQVRIFLRDFDDLERIEIWENERVVASRDYPHARVSSEYRRRFNRTGVDRNRPVAD